MDTGQRRWKQLELLSGLGAGILGAGMALMLVQWLQPFALPLLMVGIVSHGWAMLAKKRVERQANMQQPTWAKVAEWACWVMIVGMIAYVIVLSLP